MDKPDSAFEQAFAKTLKFEGGYVDDASDTGGETKYGISKKQFPTVDIENLTLRAAKEIYYAEYWLPQKCNSINDEDVAAKVFDMAVNMGLRQSGLNTQRALMSCDKRVKWDGILGSKTIAAINAVESRELLAALRSECAGFYRVVVAKNSAMLRFRNGWDRRAYA